MDDLPRQYLTWDQLPPWQQDNEHIVSGYRPPSHSWQKSLRTIFSLHNETVNIHSHLFGSILFLLLPFYAYQGVYSRYSNAKAADIVVFSTFFYGVAICFFLSATFHIFANHSPRIAALGNQLDYLGVVILMWGSTIPSIYYGLCDDPDLQKFYWTLVSILATVCAIATMHPQFRGAHFRPYRAAMYAGLGLSAVGFIVNGLVLYGWEVQNQRMSLDWMMLMAVLNLVGAAIYAARIPEKWNAEVYDIFGGSHQILHFMVILAGLAHMMGLFRAFDHVRSQTP